MNILFIEDDPMNRRVVKDMLDVAGATMAEASWAEEGLAMLDAESFDVVLVDLRMPGMDGFETIRRIRARGDAKGELPIIVVTADTAVDRGGASSGGVAEEGFYKRVAMGALFDSSARVLAVRGGGGRIL